MFSTNALAALHNLHLTEQVPVANVSSDQAALDQLMKIAGNSIGSWSWEDLEFSTMHQATVRAGMSRRLQMNPDAGSASMPPVL